MRGSIKVSSQVYQVASCDKQRIPRLLLLRYTAK